MVSVGKPQVRKEDPRFLRGEGRYVGDMVLPNMLHAAFVRSPYAHASVTAIDGSAARAMPGVRAVLAMEDLQGRVGPIPTGWRIDGSDLRLVPQWPLAHGVVRYAGEGVAVVVAEEPYQAVDAAEAVRVEYEALPVVVDQERALDEGAPLLHSGAPRNQAFRWRHQGGDVDGVFGGADVVVKQRIVNQRLQPAALETRAALASWEARGGRMTLWVTSQNPHDHRSTLSEVLAVPERSFRVVAPDVGGGFGSKGPVHPAEAVVCHLSRTLGRPVRWVEGRSENFHATVHGRDQVQYAEMAARGDGTILGLRVKSVANVGAYLSTAAPGIPTIAFGGMLSGCYAMGAVDVEVVGAFTNTTPVDAYRGAGRPEAAYLVERMVDILARRLGLDPAVVRRRNFIPAEAFPYTTPTEATYDSGNYGPALDRALDALDYRGARAEQAAARGRGRFLGIGLSSYVEMCGAAPGLPGSSTVKLRPDGRAQVHHGGSPHGQGEETAFAQIVADRLGIAVDDVDVVHGDTALVPRGVGTFGSRTLALEGSAVGLASDRVLELARRWAAQLLEAREEDLVFEGGSFHVRGSPGGGLAIQDVAFAAYTSDEVPKGLEPGLEASATFDPPDLTCPFGTHACVVEVDPPTGQVRVLRYIAVDDCGRVVNPMLVQGQVHGGVLQGIAQALWEEARYDGDGNLLTSSFMDYAMPTALEAPPIETLRTETPSPHNPLGVKGVGEAGTIAAPPAVVNAVVDALEPLGVVHLDMPLTPEKVWRAIRAGRLAP